MAEINLDDYRKQISPTESFLTNIKNSAQNMAGDILTSLGHLGATYKPEPKDFLLNPMSNSLGIMAKETGLGEWLRDKGVEISKDAQKNMANVSSGTRWEDKSVTERLFNPDYWKDPRGAAADFGSGLGSSVPFMLASLGLARFAPQALPGFATRVAAPLITRGGLGSTLGRGILRAANSRAGDVIGTTLRATAPYAAIRSPMEAFVNAGELYSPLKARGFTDEEISKLMQRNILEELPINFMEGLLEGNVLLGKGFGLLGKNWRQRLLGGAGNMGLEMLGEYWQEGAQTGNTNKFLGYPYTPVRNYLGNLIETGTPFENADERSAAVSGAIGSLLPSAGGAAYHAAFGKGEGAEYDPNFTDKQNQMWQLANYASARAKSKFNYNIPAALIYKQWAHESYENFDSPNARYNNNYGGLTQVKPNGEANKQPDGNNYYRIFQDDKEFADAYVDDFIKHYPELDGVQTEEEFASVLKSYGYFGSPLENYISGMRGIKTPHSSNEKSSENNKRKDETRIDEFMQAIGGQESGGDYGAYNGMYGASGKFQILPENWAQWASDAGLSPDAEMTPENQDLVAKNKMLEYYKKFGDWRKVAEAWYGGEGAVSWSAEAKAHKQAGGYPSINEYADSVMERFENILSSREDEDEGTEIEITPAMIENAKGKYWIEQGAVSYEGAQPQTMQALYLLGKWFYERTGKPLVVSAVTNRTSHAEGALITDDFHAGTLFNEFVKYGKSLGLGMNFEIAAKK